MKRIISTLIVLVIAFSISVHTVSAETYFMEDGFKFSVHNGYASIAGYEGTDTSVEVPLDFSGFIVDTIDIASFSDNTNITEIRLPYLLKYINSSAFAKMAALQSITIPESCERIGSHAFDGCEMLNDVKINSKSISSIAEYAFYKCSSLDSFTIPTGTKKISEFAFADCTSLEYVKIPDTVEDISDSAFSGVENLTFICSENSAAKEYADLWSIGCNYTGDANGDGSVNINDVTAIQKYKLGMTQLTEYGMLCADVNGDGDVTIRDATLIQMRIANIILSF